MKVCESCMIVHPEDTEKCPNCGGVVFTSLVYCTTCLNKQCYMPDMKGQMKRVICPQCGEGESDA